MQINIRRYAGETIQNWEKKKVLLATGSSETVTLILAPKEFDSNYLHVDARHKKVYSWNN